MLPTYRVGIIGTGGIAAWHADYYGAHPQTEVVAGADISPERLARFCDEYGVPTRYADYRELLGKERPDIVSICTWNGTHAEITIAAAEAGCAGIICEKPMAETLGDAQAMLAAAQQHGAKLAIHHQTRCAPSYAAARAAIAKGAVGDPLLVHRRGEDGLFNIGSHLFDATLYVLGDPQAAWVLGQAGRTTNRHERGTPIEDLCGAIVACESGTRIVLEIDLPGPETSSWVFVHASEGLLRFNHEQLFVLNPQAAGWQKLGLPAQPGYLQEFIAWLEGGPEHRCCARNCYGAQELMMALYASAQRRDVVHLPLQKAESALFDMIADGSFGEPEGAPYDIRSEDALRYALTGPR